MQEFRVKSILELEGVARELVAMLEESAQKVGGASVLALYGELGTGKTTFMQCLARVLGITDDTTSPTFVVMKKYPTKHDVFKELVHIDAYRIEDVDEMRPLQFDEELQKKGTIMGIEWADRIEPLIPDHALRVRFALEGDTHVLSIDGNES